MRVRACVHARACVCVYVCVFAHAVFDMKRHEMVRFWVHVCILGSRVLFVLYIGKMYTVCTSGRPGVT